MGGGGVTVAVSACRPGAVGLARLAVGDIPPTALRCEAPQNREAHRDLGRATTKRRHQTPRVSVDTNNISDTESDSLILCRVYGFTIVGRVVRREPQVQGQVVGRVVVVACSEWMNVNLFY